MAEFKKYSAIIMRMEAVDALMKAALGINGDVVRRGLDSLSYHIQFENKSEMERFHEWAQETMPYKFTHWARSSDMPESTALEILAERLGIKKIYRTFTDGDDQIILIDERGDS